MQSRAPRCSFRTHCETISPWRLEEREQHASDIVLRLYGLNLIRMIPAKESMLITSHSEAVMAHLTSAVSEPPTPCLQPQSYLSMPPMAARQQPFLPQKLPLCRTPPPSRWVPPLNLKPLKQWQASGVTSPLVRHAYILTSSRKCADTEISPYPRVASVSCHDPPLLRRPGQVRRE